MSYADYVGYVDAKGASERFAPVDDDPCLASHLYPHQRDLTRWALRKGRAAIFADTGLGKTAMQLEWARHASRHGRVLIVAPLAVAQQTVSEGSRFGVEVRYLRADDGASTIAITNYEMHDRFDPGDFVAVVLDESSILKSYTGATRNALIAAFADTPFRLACTATPAPNDFTELGNHAEFLGVKTRAEMLAEFFVHDGGKTQDWRLKGHAVSSFWRWVATWGAVVRSPADLGHDDTAFRLPPLRLHDHMVPVDHVAARKAGSLFAMPALTLSDQRATRRATVVRRVALVADIVAGDEPAVVWCGLNAESTACAAAIDGAVEVTGSMSLDEKIEALAAFGRGEARVLVSKPRICGFGLNWQHCARMAFVAPSHSYERTYQAIRRCWRFGQRRPVDVHFVAAETETAVVANYRRKEAAAERMAAEMTARCRDSVCAEVTGRLRREWNPYDPQTAMRLPAWLVNSRKVPV